MANRKTDKEKLITYVKRIGLSEDGIVNLLLDAVNEFRKDFYIAATESEVKPGLSLRLRDFYKEIVESDESELKTNLDLIISTLLITLDEYSKRTDKKTFISLFNEMIQLATVVGHKSNFGDHCLACSDYPTCFKIFDSDDVIQINENMEESQIFINLYAFFIKKFEGNKSNLLKLWKLINVVFD